MTNYRLSSGMRWSVERASILVSDGRGGAQALAYPEAAVWDLVSRGYPFSRVVALMAHIAAVDSSAAETLVRSTMEQWAANGWVEST